MADPYAEWRRLIESIKKKIEEAAKGKKKEEKKAG